MSLTATRFSRAFSSSEYSAILSLEEALFEEGYSYDGNFLEEIEISAPARPATEGDLSYLREIFWNEGIRGQDLKKEISSLCLTHGGERILHNAVRDYNGKPLSDYIAKYHFAKKLALWIANDQPSQALEETISEKLIKCDYFPRYDYADILWDYGIRWVEDAVKVYELIPHVWTKGRSLNSPYQVNLDQVVLVATNPNYRNLPLWAKVQIIKGNHASSRPGDVWRSLMPALKAWKWDNSIPKRFAKRLGEMSPKYRALGAVAWSMCEQNKNEFWSQFNQLCKNPDEAVKFLLFNDCDSSSSYYSRVGAYIRNRALEVLWGLPHKFLNAEISEKHRISEEEFAIELLAKYSDGLSGVCRMLFGCGGKQVQKLFKSSTPDHRKWAIALAYGKEDLVQKYLGADCVPYQEDAINFLKFLGEKPALRMVQTTTMTLRGKSQDVTGDYIRDTGYLFNQLQTSGVSPDLGRVRCWFSTHEVLAKEYVKILPDFELKVNPDFAPLDGLSSLDMAWEIEIPKHQHQLKRYGEILSHCVGGYGGSINSGRSVIVAAYFQGVLKYTLEFVSDGTCRKVGNDFHSNYRCNQFYGFRNSSPSYSDRATVLDMFQQAKLIN
ncbi:hypothetical protein Cl131_gp131 [Aphanizomenon phage vB_AphaS-CL131]|nr:hypothetical protein Cl131_gp131 [Aphanizomenon phage vB_AphaS-CL131]